MLLDLSLKTMTLILIEVIFLNDGSTITEDLPDSEIQLFKSRGLKRECLIVWSRKYPYPPHWMVIGDSKGMGVSKPKIYLCKAWILTLYFQMILKIILIDHFRPLT